jgi:sulfite exporter TauE/SafE
MLELALIFAIGIAGSPHCTRACGDLACRLQAFPAADGGLERQLLFNTGRVLSYALLGAFGGALSAHLVGSPAVGRVTTLAVAPDMVSLAAGGLMVFMAILLLNGPWPEHTGSVAGVERFLCSAMRSRSRIRPVSIGALAGLRPCPLVYALVALAARTAEPSTGIAIMLAFGLGTLPPMLAFGLAGEQPTSEWTRWASRFSAKLVLVLGVVTFIQGALSVP